MMARYNLSKIQNIQDFVWIGEYLDGTHLSEFDLETGKENKFYSIDKDRLRSFGLYSSQGAEMLFDIKTGIFFLQGRMYEFFFESSNNEQYYLTGRPQRYQDIITYKDAEAVFNPMSAKGGYNGITQYNFGYKAQLSYPDGTKIGFKAICHIPFGKPITIELRLVSSANLKGNFMVKRNGQIIDFFSAELSPNFAGEINWTVR